MQLNSFKIMKTCLFCSNQRTFNIHDDYGNNNHTIKDDMLVFFGYQIESHLRPDDVICHVCMNGMDIVAKLKQRLLPFIFRSNSEEDCKPLKLTKIWDALSTINLDEESDGVLSCPSPVRANLLECKRIDSYESPIEEKLAQIERQRSISCTTLRSEADSEVSKISKKGKKRKRGHNWSKRKSGRYSESRSVCSVTTRASYARSNVSRAPSVASVESYESFYLPGSPATVYTPASVAPSSNTYQSIIYQNNDFDDDFTCQELHECPEDGCTFICEDIELMSRHKEVKHKEMPLYFCDFCKKKFTQKGDLNIHLRKHEKQFACPICKREFFKATELTFHWQKHVEKSVRCSYCQKRYKDEKVLKSHMKKMHTGDIPSRVDYKTCEEPKVKGNSDYQVFFKVQSNEPIRNY